MNLTSAQKMIAAMVGIALAAVLVVVLLILPLFGVMSSLDSEAEAARQSQAAAKATLAQLEGAKENAATTQAELLRIGTEIPESPQLPTLIIEMQDIANLSGVTLTRIVPAQPADLAGAGYSEIAIDTGAESTWADLLDYMRRVNSTTRLLRITDLSIAPVAAAVETTVTDTETELTTSLKMKAYVYGGAAGVPAAPAP